MTEAYLGGSGSTIETAGRLGIAVIASATLLQTKVIDHMPETLARNMPGLVSNFQRAIQFTRSTPGVAVALVGMGRRAHLEHNLGIARVRPLALEEYQRLHQ